MKKIFILLLIIIVLFSGCSNTNTLDNLDEKNSPNETYKIKSYKEKKDINKFYNYLIRKISVIEYDRNYLNDVPIPEEDIDMFNSIDINETINSMEKINNIKIKDYNKDNKEVYKDKKYKNIILKNEFPKHIEIEEEYPEIYEKYINNIIDSENLYLTHYVTGGEEDLLAFSNIEYNILMEDNNMFMSYNTDAIIQTENIPIHFMLYLKNNELIKAQLISVDIKYNNYKVTEENNLQIKSVFSEFGISNTEEIIKIFETAFNNKSIDKDKNLNYKYDFKSISTENANFEYNDIIIKFS